MEQLNNMLRLEQFNDLLRSSVLGFMFSDRRCNGLSEIPKPKLGRRQKHLPLNSRQ